MDQFFYLAIEIDDLNIAVYHSPLFVEEDHGWHREDVQFVSGPGCLNRLPRISAPRTGGLWLSSRTAPRKSYRHSRDTFRIPIFALLAVTKTGNHSLECLESHLLTRAFRPHTLNKRVARKP